MIGWIKLHRDLLDWQWFNSSKHLSLFLALLLRANYEPVTWRHEKLAVGQILTGRKQLSQWTGLSERSVRTILKDLKTTNEVTIKTCNRYSIITITNYLKYQGPDQPADQLTTSKRPANDHILRSKEVKKLRIKKDTMSGKQPDLSVSVLKYLNLKAQTSYREIDTNLIPIKARLKDLSLKPITQHPEYSAVKWCEMVIDERIRLWGNDLKMKE